MNIGIRLHDVKGNGLEEKLRNAKDQGFTCVHLALSKVVDGFSMDKAPTLLTEGYARTVKGLLDKYQMEVAVLGCYLNLATPDLEALQRTAACYYAHLHFGALIGARVVGTETGAPNTAYATTSECFTEKALTLFIERLRPVIRMARAEGIPLAIEPVCRHIVSTPQRAKAVLDAIGSDYCKIILDPVNLLNVENHTRQEAIFDEALQLLGKDISVVHWKDYVLSKGELVSLGGGLGQLRGGAVVRFLAQHPDMPVTLEDTVPENAVKVRSTLEKQLFSASQG